MKPIILTFALLSMTGAVYAQSDHQTFTQPIAEEAEDACTGEPLTYTGECRITVRTRTTNDGETQTTQMHCVADGLGVFGREYVYRASTTDRTEVAGCDSTQTIRQRERFNSAGSDGNFFITFNFKVITDQFCVTHVVQDETTTDCHGKSGGGF